MPVLPMPTTARPSKDKKTQSRRKIFIYLTLVVCMSWAAYLLFSTSSPSTKMSTTPPSPTAAAGPPNALTLRPDLIRVQDLPPTYLPETGKHRSSGKLVVVGDVHGMEHSLRKLLQKVSFNEKHDHLILAGDMISKGPNSRGVVDLAMRLGASGVRGNHEDRIIVAHAKMLAEGEVMAEEGDGTEEEEDEDDDGVEESGIARKDRKLIKRLGEKRIRWLSKCPVILRVGDLGEMKEVVVVHAGLAPGVELEKQDPEAVMNMRTIGHNGVPRDDHNGKGWMKAWNKYQKGLPKKKRMTVIYGHDSKRGLVKEKYSIGIDTGCLRGGKLTAVVIEGGPSEHQHKIVHVNCKDGRV